MEAAAPFLKEGGRSLHLTPLEEEDGTTGTCSSPAARPGTTTLGRTSMFCMMRVFVCHAVRCEDSLPDFPDNTLRGG